MAKLKLCVWRTGEVVIDNEVPYGSILVCEGTGKFLKSLLVYCRLMKDGSGRHLVNDIPEANTEKQAEDALERFKLICSNKQEGIAAFDGLIELRESQNQ